MICSQPVTNSIDVESEKNSRIPNHSKHTVGIRPDKDPWSKPSRALAIHRFEILETFATTLRNKIYRRNQNETVRTWCSIYALGKIRKESCSIRKLGRRAIREMQCAVPINIRPPKFVRLITETCVTCHLSAWASSYSELLLAYRDRDMVPTLFISRSKEV